MQTRGDSRDRTGGWRDGCVGKIIVLYRKGVEVVHSTLTAPALAIIDEARVDGGGSSRWSGVSGGERIPIVDGAGGSFFLPATSHQTDLSLDLPSVWRKQRGRLKIPCICGNGNT